jgi:hypothetical protein
VASVDLFIAVVWLALSTFFGVLVIGVTSVAPAARARWRSGLFWLQCTFILIGLFRLAWAFGSLTTFILRKFG